MISEKEYKCHCRWGYVGKHCELATACLSNVCRGRGECLVKPDGSFECICLRGYYGTTCEHEEDGKFRSSFNLSFLKILLPHFDTVLHLLTAAETGCCHSGIHKTDNGILVAFTKNQSFLHSFRIQIFILQVVVAIRRIQQVQSNIQIGHGITLVEIKHASGSLQSTNPTKFVLSKVMLSVVKLKHWPKTHN